MKKFFVALLFVALLFVSCGPSETKVSFTNENNLSTMIFNECVESLKHELKDPSSLKFDSSFLYAYEVPIEIAVKSTDTYDIYMLLNKKEEEAFSYFNEHNEKIANIYNSKIDDCKYYIVPIKYYAKNSYGAYVSDYINIIVVVFPKSIDKYGIIEYEGTNWEGD